MPLLIYRYKPPKYFNGTLDAFVKISKVEGITSLWSGLCPTLVLQIPSTVIFFTTYEQLKAIFMKNSPDPTHYEPITISASSGLARMVTVPEIRNKITPKCV